MKEATEEVIYVLDFGSQYAHLITRRIREAGVLAELVSPDFPLERLAQARGIILSGGPQNLSKKTDQKSALVVNKGVYSLGVPILGICYGMQLTAHLLGGKVKAGKAREYGSTKIKTKKGSTVLARLNKEETVWMSHGDQVVKVPEGFKVTASSQNCPIAGMENSKKKIYCLQFHPEVKHTIHGERIIKNFLAVTGIKKTWSMDSFIRESVKKIKDVAGKDKVISALSGGVDSAVASTLVYRAIGKNLTSIYVDTGLMREGETAQIKRTFQKSGLKVIDAKKEFLLALRGERDPERKRKIIGALFIKIFEREAKKTKGVKWLVQGTLYTDAISSGVSAGGKHAAVIKSHHNVGGLPKNLGFGLVEPLRDLYKYEVRVLGQKLGLPKAIWNRQPFPGPGLAVRIIGEVTKERLEMVRSADKIVCEEIERVGVDASQYFAVLPDVKSVGVQGDARTYGHPIVLRAITTKDFMTADWTRLPYSLLEKISTRITNEVKGINRVVYDITSKPPGTVEWE